ncbi:MAG: hypothetical protein BWX54_01143 [Verrucomicrobia bacterium ADurb.Bin018]|nr:MAG: hypothetical protein BWX54_01143 [Verrucomicrobia bacterium ADurb.Bin018]
MANELYEAVKRVQVIVRDVPGIKLAPEDPTESASEFPFAFTYLSSEERMSDSYGAVRSDATLVCDVVIPRTNLAVNLQTLMPYADSIQNALYKDWIDNQWGSTITELKKTRCKLVNLDIAKQQMIGLRFEIDVKIRDTIT